MADIQKLNVNGNTYDISTTWAKVTGKPSTFTPSSHTHTASEVSGLPTKLSAFTNDVGFVTVRQKNGFSYNNLATLYTPHASIYRIDLTDVQVNIWTMLFIEVSLRQNYSPGYGGKILINLYHNTTSDFTQFNATILGNLNNIYVYSSDRRYIYISASMSYSTISVDRVLVGDNAVTADLSNITIDKVDSLPDTYQTATIYNGLHTGNFTKSLVEGVLTGNITSHTHSYLPLTGGIITGTLVKRHTGQNYITFQDSDGNAYGYLGFNGANTPIYIPKEANAIYTLLHSGNYNSYAPTLTGTGASGTWGINISGNAATATNATNADTLDGYHSYSFHKDWDTYAGGSYTGWVRIMKWTTSVAGHFSPHPFLLNLYREYYSPASEAYTLSFTFGWDSANIVQLNGNGGTRIIEKFRISKTSDQLTYYLEYYVNPNYSTYANTCRCIISSCYDFGSVELINEVASGNTLTLHEITTKLNSIVGNVEGNASSASNVPWSGVTNKPTSFTPASHTHSYLPLSGGTLTGLLNITSNGITATYGAQNNSWVHFYNSTGASYYFDNQIHVDGAIKVYNTSWGITSGGRFDGSGFYQSSDERLKTFYEPIKPDLEKLRKLRKNYFKFNDKDKLEIGVSAQEVQSIYPEIVSENSDGYLSVAYDKLSVIALAAIDELDDKILQLANKISTLENILNKLMGEKGVK